MHHVARRLLESGLADVMARLLAQYDAANVVVQIGVASAPVQDSVEVVIALREEAGADLAVGGEADAAAVSAEGVRDRGDDADLSQAVVEAVAAGGLAWRVGGEVARGTVRVEAGDDLVRGDDGLGLPAAVLFERHPLDE